MESEKKVNTPLAKYLLAQGIKKNVFAKRIQVSGPTLTHLISGRNPPSLLMAYRIQKETGGKVKMTDWIKLEDVE